MKKLLFILLIVPMIGFGQGWKVTPAKGDLVYQWGEYLKDCNELVSDTVLQEGIVSLKYKPVIKEGEVNHFIIAPIDTVWKDVECMDYRHYSNFNTLSGRLSIGDGYSITSNAHLSFAANIPSYTYSPVEQKPQEITITRNKICMIKKRQASWEDFWNRWLKEKGIIGFN